MALEIKRLHLASLQGVDGRRWPVHGFVVTHPGGAVLVDTGVGGPQHVLDDWRVVNRSVADALAELDMSPADIGLVINTHLHFDHCGQNAVFKHAPFYVQRAELNRMRARARARPVRVVRLHGRAAFELLDGGRRGAGAGLEVIATPGAHRRRHQCVVVAATAEPTCSIGDAAYTPDRHATPSRPAQALRTEAGLRPAGLARRRSGCIRSLDRHQCPSARTPTSCQLAEAVMQIFAEAGAYQPPSGGEPNDWIVHLSSRT